MTATEVPKQGKGVKQAVGLSHGHKARESGGDGNPAPLYGTGGGVLPLL